MPHCQHALKVQRPDEANKIIAQIAVEYFRAQDAYPLTDGMWNIDGGENNVRAIHRDNNGIIKFFCRYEGDLPRTEAKIADFASKHDGECSLID
ncbi:hypothetical protein [Alteromonas sp. OM2203]|uniref:hypothetical protein n=1 Tax=Alteromonas sp. OM2203 TaxID=3398817 RepID=UPI003AF34224